MFEPVRLSETQKYRKTALLEQGGSLLRMSLFAVWKTVWKLWEILLYYLTLP